MSDTFLVLFVSVVYVCTCRSLQDEIRIACRGLSRLSGQGYGRSVRGGGNRPNRFCECAIVGLHTTFNIAQC